MSAIKPRKLPKQARARARYQEILECARQLISARGNDAVSVRDIAKVAGVPIASIYQYFPDKNAILWTLVEGQLHELEESVERELGAATTLDELSDASRALFRQFAQMFFDDPALAQIWRSIQANVVLRELDRDYTERLAEHFVVNAKRLGLKQPEEAVRDFAILAGHLGTTAMQFINELEGGRQERMLDLFIDMVSPRLTD